MNAGAEGANGRFQPWADECRLIEGALPLSSGFLLKPQPRPTVDALDRSLLRPFAICLLLGPTVACAAEAGSQPTREAQWHTDLEVLGTQLEARHPDLYHSMSCADFRAELRNIRSGVSSLSDYGVALALARLLARIGDGHTLVPLLWDASLGYRRLPVELVRTADGVSILAADSSFTGVVGSRVLRIGSLPAEQVLDSVSILIPRDNAWTPRPIALSYAVVTEILQGLGITDSAARAPLLVEDPAGTRDEIEVDAVDRDAAVAWDYGAYEGAAPWLARREDPYWMTVLPGDSIVYVQFNRLDRDQEEESVAEFGQRLLKIVKEGSVRRVVLDLRWNHGGSRWRGRHLLGALVAVEHELGAPRSSRARTPRGHLVTLIGPGTFSAANMFALDLDLHTNTAFVGLPTGGKPNHFGELGRFRLPESGLQIRHSVYYRQATHPRDTRPAIFPDQRVEWRASDVSAGRDPQMEAALSWHPQPSGLGEMRRRIRRDGVDPALVWLDSLVWNPSPAMQVTEAEVNRLGYGLLQEEQLREAAAVFRWNLDAHPWSANAHDSLADAYLELGKEQEAKRLLCRALRIDPQFDRALERGLDCAS